MAIFDHTHPKIIESTLYFPEFVPACKKNQFIPSVHFWDTTLEFCDQTGHTHFLPSSPKKNLINF